LLLLVLAQFLQAHQQQQPTFVPVNRVSNLANILTACFKAQNTERNSLQRKQPEKTKLQDTVSYRQGLKRFSLETANTRFKGLRININSHHMPANRESLMIPQKKDSFFQHSAQRNFNAFFHLD